MSISLIQLKNYIIEPCLRNMGLYSESAVNLLLGTAAHESHLGEYIKQTNGPALGIYQMEPNTFHYVWDNHISTKINILSRIRLYCGYSNKPDSSRLMSDLILSTILARIYYLSMPEQLPASTDIDGIANYWKKYWNTEKGKGKIEDFINNYRKYVYNVKDN